MVRSSSKSSSIVLSRNLGWQSLVVEKLQQPIESGEVLAKKNLYLHYV